MEYNLKYQKVQKVALFDKIKIIYKEHKKSKSTKSNYLNSSANDQLLFVMVCTL